jgi:hypothetical protein
MVETTEAETVAERISDLVGLKGSFEEVGTGVIARKNNRSFWIDGETLERELEDLPVNVQDQLRRGRGLRYLESELDGVHKFKGERRAPKFLKALERELGAKGRLYLEYRPDVERATTREADVPVRIAAEGKYYVAAWLAAHGHDNVSISNALDVAESTIKVNLSKFKNGDL